MCFELNVLICWKLTPRSRVGVFFVCLFVCFLVFFRHINVGSRAGKAIRRPPCRNPPLHRCSSIPGNPDGRLALSERLPTSPPSTATTFAPRHPSLTRSCCHHIWERFHPKPRARESERRRSDPRPPVTSSVPNCCDTWRSPLFEIRVVPIRLIYSRKLLISSDLLVV